MEEIYLSLLDSVEGGSAQTQKKKEEEVPSRPNKDI